MPKKRWDKVVCDAMDEKIILSGGQRKASVMTNYQSKQISTRLKNMGKRIIVRKAQMRTRRRREAEKCLRATITFVSILLAAQWVPEKKKFVDGLFLINLDSTGYSFHTIPGGNKVIKCTPWWDPDWIDEGEETDKYLRVKSLTTGHGSGKAGVELICVKEKGLDADEVVAVEVPANLIGINAPVYIWLTKTGHLDEPKFRKYLKDIFIPYVANLRSDNPDIADEQQVLWLDGETAQINAIIDPTLRQELDDLNIVVCKSNPARTALEQAADAASSRFPSHLRGHP
jgi:hypothetical protein